MADESKEQLENLKTEVVSLRIRVKRLEDFFNAFPDPSDYYIRERPFSPDERDDLFDEAVRVVSQHDKASASLIQRRLQLGFNRAARLLEQFEEAGAVGPADGSKPRDVLVKDSKEFLKNLKKEEK